MSSYFRDHVTVLEDAIATALMTSYGMTVRTSLTLCMK